MNAPQIGIIGLGTMGASLARNALHRGASVAVFNRTTEKTDAFAAAHGSEGALTACTTLDELKNALQAPRAVLLMVNAGKAVDDVLEEFVPLLEKGDILIDGGNSHYKDTARREAFLKEKGIHFMGMGISGGEEGALHGPSMMPGGSAEAYKLIEPLLLSMAADDGDGGKCVTYIGPAGAGHFVKTVHNGIEYALMQLLAEGYDVLRTLGKFSNAQLADTFEAWNTYDLQSFLVEISVQIFRHQEEGVELIDVVKADAHQKGTGKWTTEAALEYGVPIPTINAAVDARFLSSVHALRKGMPAPPEHLDLSEPVPLGEKFKSIMSNALELSFICAYKQGFELLEKASEQEQWALNFSDIARIWRGGCIIRSAMLRRFQAALHTDERRAQAAKDALLERFQGERQWNWRHIVDLATSRGVPVPAIVSTLCYYDALKKDVLPQNLIQAQRDAFGAHTYERTDREGTFHSIWLPSKN